MSSFPSTHSFSSFYLWHSHLSHVSSSCLKFLASTRALEKLQTHDISYCSVCKLAKFLALPFNRSVSASSSPFDLIHLYEGLLLFPQKEGIDIMFLLLMTAYSLLLDLFDETLL